MPVRDPNQQSGPVWLILGHSPVFIFLLALVSLALVALADALKPFELGFSAFYVLPVLIATWGLGMSRGLGFALLSACFWYCLDLTSGRLFSIGSSGPGIPSTTSCPIP